MDRRADIAPAVAAELIDQAVYSSIRSPVARGYRIVAASPGLTEDEKREIVQRAPSHGNLTDATEAATAAASFRLRSDRQAVLFARHAGPEPSGRGGLRVYTHILLMTPETYRNFAADPLRAEPLSRSQVEATLRSPGVTALERLNTPLLLSVTGLGVAGLAPDVADRMVRVVAAVLSEQATIVVNAPQPRQILDVVLAALPVGRRERLSFAYGMKLSPQRDMRLLFHADSPAVAEAYAADHGYTTLDWMAATPLGGPFAAWLELVKAMLESGRLAELRRLTDGQAGPGTAAQLATFAGALMPRPLRTQPLIPRPHAPAAPSPAAAPPPPPAPAAPPAAAAAPAPAPAAPPPPAPPPQPLIRPLADRPPRPGKP